MAHVVRHIHNYKPIKCDQCNYSTKEPRELCRDKGIQCVPKYRSYPTNRAKVDPRAKAQRKKPERPLG